MKAYDRMHEEVDFAVMPIQAWLLVDERRLWSAEDGGLPDSIWLFEQPEPPKETTLALFASLDDAEASKKGLGADGARPLGITSRIALLALLSELVKDRALTWVAVLRPNSQALPMWKANAADLVDEFAAQLKAAGRPNQTP